MGATFEQRQQATARYEQAAAAINAMFDALDALRTAVNSTRAESHTDPIHDAEHLIEHAATVQACLDELRSAALAASDYEKRAQLAGFLQTRAARLFPPRPAPPSPPAPPSWEEN